MTALIAGFFQRSNIGLGTWNWGDVAFGFRSGLLLNQPSFTEIAYNNRPNPPPLNALGQFQFLAIPFQTKSKALKLARIDTLVARQLRTIDLSAIALTSLDLLAIYQNVYHQKVSEDHTIPQKFLIHAWKAIPYIALITNIALTILELRSNCMKASVALAVTSITLLSFNQMIPKTWAWYINPGLRIPMDLVALYYGSNKNRFVILIGLAQLPIIKDPVMNFTKPYTDRLMSYLRSNGLL
ncbi:MAG: hypothetical protein JSS10_01235 [Verrucomicrobia bacterium]|nr:hypothetical protein [Verrucomicrobiota bacterium]